MIFASNAEITEIPLDVTSNQIQYYSPVAHQGTIFVYDNLNLKLLKVNPDYSSLTELLAIPSNFEVAFRSIAKDERGNIYILAREKSLLPEGIGEVKLLVVNLSSPSSYAVRSIPAEMKNLAIQSFSVSFDGTLYLLDSAKLIHAASLAGVYLGSVNVSFISPGIPAERVSFEVSPKSNQLAVISYKDGVKQAKKISIYNLVKNKLKFSKTYPLTTTYPETVKFSKSGKDIYVGGFFGLEKKLTASPKKSTIFKTSKNKYTPIYKFYTGNTTVYSSDSTSTKIFKILPKPLKNTVGATQSATLPAGHTLESFIVNSVSTKALVTTSSESDSTGHLLVLDLK